MENGEWKIDKGGWRVILNVLECLKLMRSIYERQSNCDQKFSFLSRDCDLLSVSCEGTQGVCTLKAVASQWYFGRSKYNRSTRCTE